MVRCARPPLARATAISLWSDVLRCAGLVTRRPAHRPCFGHADTRAHSMPARWMLSAGQPARLLQAAPPPVAAGIRPRASRRPALRNRGMGPLASNGAAGRAPMQSVCGKGRGEARHGSRSRGFPCSRRQQRAGQPPAALPLLPLPQDRAGRWVIRSATQGGGGLNLWHLPAHERTLTLNLAIAQCSALERRGA
jgi:hypothetical protein